MNDLITRDLDQGLLTLSFNRPDKLNAVNTAMYQQLGDLLLAAGEDPDVEAIIITGGPQCFTAGNDLRDFLDNPPADDGMFKAGGSEKPHALYNIGNNRSEALMKVIGLIEDACGRKAELTMLPMQPGDVPKTYADIEAIRRDMGYEPSTPIEVGVPRFVEWFRDYHGR